MIQPHAKTQQKIVDFINTLPNDSDITVPMFYHLFGQHKSVINKALRKLCLKGIIEFDRTEKPSRGGNLMNVYKKVATPEDTFEFGLIKDGPFADLFLQPYPCTNAREVRLLTAKEEFEADDDLS